MAIDPPTLLARLLLALAIGAAFGIDRSLQGEAAGMRTYALVAFGSALLTAVLSYGFSGFARQSSVQLDPGRVVSQIVVGIGFLGGGAIVVQGGIRRGVTTAAGIWLMAGIGIAAGLGMYAATFIAGALGLFVLVPLRFIEERYFRHAPAWCSSGCSRAPACLTMCCAWRKRRAWMCVPRASATTRASMLSSWS